jgi:hypothetical protein
MAFEKDDLGRQTFADLLIDLSTGLASATVLPAGRVIAVDAPWGSGKSWIAKRLPEHFKDDSRIGACVYVDAFEFDYHQDPFAVVTSAILDNYKTETAVVKSFKNAAIDILKVTLPAVGKGLVKAGINYAGFDDKIVESIEDAGEAASEKAISKMLETFTKTTETTNAFKSKLETLVKTNEEQAPLVVVIDELDRCRPSFALEMLERVKHLFDVPNVVFIFFVHTPALHSAICKTYGHDINPSEYLRKFIAITTGLPIANKSFPDKLERTDFIRKFLYAQYPPAAAETRQEQEFKNALMIFAVTFDASFRDIENVMLIWHLLKRKIGDLQLFAAYFLLIRIKEPKQFKALKDRSFEAYNNEIIRLGESQENGDYYTNYIRDMFLYAIEPDLYTNSLSKNAKKLKSHKSEMDNRNDLRFMLMVLGILELEYLRI